MHQRPETGGSRFDPGRPHPSREPRERSERRLDLSVPQVVASVLAAVAAAVLASRLGVYGTIVGAGVVSAVATCGGPLIQHLFSRTGDQLRDVRTPVRGRRLPPAEPVPLSLPPSEEPAGGFGAATTHGTRMRGWKRPAAAAAVVFGVAMAGITGYELLSGSGLDGAPGTTVGSVVRGGPGGGGGSGGGSDTSPRPGAPSSGPEDGTGDRTEREGSPGDDPAAPTPGEDGNGGSGEPDPPGGKPSPGPSATPDPSAPEPTPPATEAPGTAAGTEGGSRAPGADSGSRTGTGAGTAGSTAGGG
ncbi:hypothetical protein ACIQ9E_01020 [Streptomyces sp. NPDC094448]|uniref:hypothetical protein n=1 Tax=Streptomyces sp. NPDC094448 TaxID=3366063 RepID=UPI0037FD9619